MFRKWSSKFKKLLASAGMATLFIMAPSLAEKVQAHIASQSQTEIRPLSLQPGEWIELTERSMGNPYRLSLEALAQAEARASQASGRRVVFYKVIEGNKIYTNLIDSQPRGVVNRMTMFSRGVMMEGLHSDDLFVRDAYKMNPNGHDMSLLPFIQQAHNSVVALARQQERERFAINTAPKENGIERKAMPVHTAARQPAKAPVHVAVMPRPRPASAPVIVAQTDAVPLPERKPAIAEPVKVAAAAPPAENIRAQEMKKLDASIAQYKRDSLGLRVAELPQAPQATGEISRAPQRNAPPAAQFEKVAAVVPNAAPDGTPKAVRPSVQREWRLATGDKIAFERRGTRFNVAPRLVA